jgi:hypothetical protein
LSSSMSAVWDEATVVTPLTTVSRGL